MANLTNIYDTVPAWVTATTYNLYDLITINGLFYYALSKHVSAAAFATDLASSLWGGRYTLNSINKPHFFWKPSYNSPVESQPKMRSIKFGESYEQRANEGLNNNLLKINYNFDEKSDDETLNICHFLHTRAGTESFVFVPPKPYGMAKLFVCKLWAETFVFSENHQIRATFEETPN